MGSPIIKKILLGVGYYLLFGVASMGGIIGILGLLLTLPILIWFSYWYLSKQYSRQETLGTLTIFNLIAGFIYYIYNTDISKLVGSTTLFFTAILAFEYFRLKRAGKKSSVQLSKEFEHTTKTNKKLNKWLLWCVIAFVIVFGTIYGIHFFG